MYILFCPYFKRSLVVDFNTMNQNKLLDIQRQAVQNTAELNDYIKGLDSWCADIKKKDQSFMDMKPKNKVC